MYVYTKYRKTYQTFLEILTIMLYIFLSTVLDKALNYLMQHY